MPVDAAVGGGRQHFVVGHRRSATRRCNEEPLQCLRTSVAGFRVKDDRGFANGCEDAVQLDEDQAIGA